MCRLDPNETFQQRTLRLRNIQAFVKFKKLVPGFSATINRFEDHPDLIDEFVNIVSNSTSLIYVNILMPSPDC